MENFNLNSFVDAIKKTGRTTIDAIREMLSAEEPAPVPEGKLTARGRIEALFDAGTFSETGALVRRRPSEFDSGKPDEFEGVITGWGAVSGRLVYAFSQDLSRTGGAVSEAHAKKICSLYRLAVRNGAPVVGFFDSSGAFIPEGVRALAGYGRIMKAVSGASGVVPQIALIPGYCSGASAVIASMFDLEFIVKDGGSISVNPPFIAEGAGGADFAAATGTVAGAVADDGEAVTLVRRLLPYLPDNNESGSVLDTKDDANRAADLSGFDSDRDVRSLIRAVADDGKFYALYADYAPEAVAGIASFGGVPVGVVGTNRAVNDGVLTAAAARKITKCVSFFDSFNIPILTVVDSRGLDRTTAAEEAPYSAELARLASAYAAAASPLVTLIAGEAYGSVFSVLGSKAIGADAVLALDTAKIAAMRADAAVAFLHNGEINADVTREDLEKLWDEKVADPAEAASCGEIDAVVDRSELRARLCAAIYMTARKTDAWNSRRHPDGAL